jgi:hypothetical protein
MKLKNIELLCSAHVRLHHDALSEIKIKNKFVCENFLLEVAIEK